MGNVVETKICKHCNTPFSITDKDLEFYEKVSPVFPCLPSREERGVKKYLIPIPSLCPQCREQRRFTFRNLGFLYRRKCGATGKDIISIYSPDKPYEIYEQNYWWSDKWNPMDYQRDFEDGIPFFEQFKKLMLECPLPSMSTKNNENCDFTNSINDSKNCFLVFGGAYDQDSLYSKYIYTSKNIVDSLLIFNSEICYNCIEAKGCYHVFHSINVQGCSDSEYLINCTGCNFCYGCSDLTNKKYCIFNSQYDEISYFEEIKKHKQISSSDMIKKVLQLSYKTPKLYAHNKGSINVYGNNIHSSKNCYNVYDGENLEDVKHSAWIFQSKDIYDGFGGDNQELGIELLESGVGGFSFGFNLAVWDNVSHIYCSMYCFNSSYLFGCIGLRNKSYCIFNKQYTKEEYEILVPHIIEHMQKTGEWGEFFPSSISPFGYNETVAQEYFPLSRGDVIPVNAGIYKNEPNHSIDFHIKHEDEKSNTFLRGPIFNWSDYEAPFPKVEKIIPASKLPDDITKIPDDILNWAIECEVTKKPFRIIKQELEFYRKHNLPIPHKHPDQRHLERMQLRNPRKLFTRHCDNCKEEIQTTYAPERPEIVYCEECYNREVY